MTPPLAELIDFLAELVADDLMRELESSPPVEVPQVEEVAQC